MGTSALPFPPQLFPDCDTGERLEGRGGGTFRCPQSMAPAEERKRGPPVRIAVRVKGTHVVHLLEVDVGEDQLVVAAVDDSGPVRASEDVGGGKRTESPQHCGLRAQSHLLAVTQQAYRKNGVQRRKEGKQDEQLGVESLKAAAQTKNSAIPIIFQKAPHSESALLTCLNVEPEVEKCPIPQGTKEVVATLKGGHQDGPRNDLCGKGVQ